jgi:hypothetical protein
LTGSSGSMVERGRLAAADALSKGATRLGAEIIRVVAEHGAQCWQTYEKIAAQISQRNGNQPHERSVGRLCRNMRAEGLLTAKRRYPGQRICAGARFRTSHGCLVQRVPWLPKPPPKRAPEPKHEPRPRHIAAVPVVTRQASGLPPTMPPDLAAAVEGLGAAMQSRWTQDEQRAIEADQASYTAARRARPPPEH